MTVPRWLAEIDDLAAVDLAAVDLGVAVAVAVAKDGVGRGGGGTEVATGLSTLDRFLWGRSTTSSSSSSSGAFSKRGVGGRDDFGAVVLVSAEVDGDGLGLGGRQGVFEDGGGAGTSSDRSAHEYQQ